MTVNKLDRCFLELMLDGEEAYSGFRRTIESANVIMATYADELLGDTQVFPEKGTVSFSAGLHGWAFTLTVFADLYAKKFGVEVSCTRLQTVAQEMLAADRSLCPAVIAVQTFVLQVLLNAAPVSLKTHLSAFARVIICYHDRILWNSLLSGL